MTDSDNNIAWKPWVILVVGLWLLSWILLIVWPSTWSDRGTFGDMFGAVNALFSGLAFAGIIYTILLQKEELKLQRKELELTRNELARSAESQERQAETMKRAARLNAMGSLLDTYSNWGIFESNKHLPKQVLLDEYRKKCNLMIKSIDFELDRMEREYLTDIADKLNNTDD